MVDFYRATLYAKRAVCRRRVSVCVCVCHTPVLFKTAKRRIMQLVPHDRSAILVYTDKRVAPSLCHSRVTCLSGVVRMLICVCCGGVLDMSEKKD